jgi:hypothetical protein
MHHILVKLHRTADLSTTMNAMRVWLDDQGRVPSKFTCDKSPGWLLIRVDFKEDDDAEAFKSRFGGSEEAPARDTMDRVCWWRLMAEEIRTEADGFASTSARDTMLFAARTLDRMPNDLERRLDRE